jgi:hypothetical protein
MTFWNCHECGAANDLGMKVCGNCHAGKSGPLYRLWLRHPVLTFGVPLAGLFAALVWALAAMRRAWPLPPLVLVLALTGCVATKADIDTLGGPTIHVKRVAFFNRTELTLEAPGGWQIGYNGGPDAESMKAIASAAAALAEAAAKAALK